MSEKAPKGFLEVALPFALHLAVMYGFGVIFHLLLPSTGWAPWWFGGYVGAVWTNYNER